MEGRVVDRIIPPYVDTGERCASRRIPCGGDRYLVCSLLLLYPLTTNLTILQKVTYQYVPTPWPDETIYPSL